MFLQIIFIKQFLRSETGAITVDWVALTAALCLMIAAFFAGFNAQVTTAVSAIFAGLTP